MKSAPYPKHESRRLQLLRQYNILDTSPEPEYDSITKLASIICGTSVALVSLIDEHRQWFKSSVGLDATETSRDLAFCAHAILAPEEIFIVPDTLEDDRFFDNPLVTADPKIRFYAGCPLNMASGDKIGTLCVIDKVPRTLTPEQKDALKLLAGQVVTAIESRLHKKELLELTCQLEEAAREKNKEIEERIKAETKLQEISELNKLIVESSPDLIFVKDAQFRLVMANQALLSAFPKETRSSVIGTTAMENFTEEEQEGYKANDRRAFKEGSSETIESATFSNGVTTTLFTKKVRFSNAKGENLILGISRDISDIKKAEEALRESSRLNDAILSSASHMVIATDIEGTVLVFNSKAEQMLGYKADEVMHKHTPALWHKKEEILERARELSSELKMLIEPGFAVFTGKVLEHGIEEREWTFIRKDGTSFPGFLTATALKDHEQNVVGFLKIVQDISERTRMLKELSISEERLHLASSGTSDGLWDWDIVTGNHYFSPRFEEMLGYEPGELVANIDTFKAHLHPEDHEKTFVAVRSHFADRIPYDIDYRVRNKSGRYIWINARGQASWDEKNAPVRMTGFVTDVTRRKEAEEARRLSNMESMRLLAMIQTAPYYMGMADVHGNLQYHNRAAKLLIGLPEDFDMSSLKISDMHPAWAMKRLVDEAIPATYEKGVWRGETALLSRKGEEIPVSQVLTLYRDERGEPICLTTIIQDITEQKRLERLKTDFISTVSHELRTPLTSIRGSLGLMKAGVVGEMAPKARQMTEIAYKNVERLILLINDILDIDKIESGQMRFDIEPHDVNSLVNQTIESNMPYAEKFGVRFTVEPIVPPAQVAVDADRFIQVLSNLLSNAAKFSKPGDEVHMAVARRDKALRISVIDKGSGIPEEFRSRIFSKFAQVDSSASRQKGGTGLGLNISKRFIEQMNGEIGFTSALGKGSTFWIEFPETEAQSFLPARAGMY